MDSPDEAGPGGFNSTRAYPSRLSQDLISAGHSPRKGSISIASEQRRRSSVGTSLVNVPTFNHSFLPQSMHVSVPKPVLRAGILVLIVLTCVTLIVAPATFSLKAVQQVRPVNIPVHGEDQHALPTSAILKELRSLKESKPIVEGKGRRGNAQQRLSNEAAPARVYRKPSPNRLPPAIELMALQSYLLADPLNALSETLDTSLPLDPHTVLGMATNDLNIAELKKEVEPVVIWAYGDVWTTPINNLLSLYALSPSPLILPMDDRPDLPVLQSLLARMIPSRSQNPTPLPMVVIGGQAFGGYESLLALHQSEELHAILEGAGAKVDGATDKQVDEEVKQAKIREVRQAVVERVERRK